jgi:hypothetical protein
MACNSSKTTKKMTFEEKLSTYEKKYVTQKEFDELPEYSLSTPTQGQNGLGVKKWKCRTPYDAPVEDAIWFYGYIEGDLCKYKRLLVGTPVQKFDINNLPSLKIRVANVEESKRAQVAFFALGNSWVAYYGQNIHYAEHPFLFARLGQLSYCFREGYFNSSAHTEISLAELEAIAAEKLSEKTMGNDPTIDMVQADEQSGAQKRYDAARKFMNDFPNGHVPLLGGYVDQALRIASGIDRI